jgi:hypothetical protein
MESMLSFATKFTNIVKKHIEETNECIGKDIVDSNAVKTGICVDKIKHAYGAKFSLLGQKYSENESKQIEAFNEDLLVCQGIGGHFFVPASDVLAMGKSVLLIRSILGQPEIGETNGKRDETFKRFYVTKEAIKKILPGVETPIQRKKKRVNLFHLMH